MSLRCVGVRGKGGGEEGLGDWGGGLYMHWLRFSRSNQVMCERKEKRMLDMCCCVITHVRWCMSGERRGEVMCVRVCEE